MQSTKKGIVFLKTTPTHVRLFNRVYKALENNDEYACYIVDMLELIKLPCSKLLCRILPDFVFKKLLNFYHRRFWVLYIVLFRKKYLAIIEGILKEYNAECIVLMDQYIGLRQCVCSLIAKKMDLTIIAIPYVVQSLHDIILSRERHILVKRSSNSMAGCVIKLIFPQWVVKQSKRRVLWAFPLEIIGLHLLGVNVKDPQKGVNDIVDALLVPSSETKNRLIECGLDNDKIEVIGDIAFDIFYDQKKVHKQWLRKNDISENKKITIYSIVPELNFNTVYGSYEQYLNKYIKIFEGLKKNGWAIILNPRSWTKNQAIERFSDAGYPIYKGDISEILPHADLYITSYSSTILWAVALGIPSVDHDIYNFKYKGYENIDSVKRFSAEDDIETFFMEKVVCDDYFNDWTVSSRKLSRKLSRKYGGNLIDGNVMKRIIYNIEKIRQIKIKKGEK